MTEKVPPSAFLTDAAKTYILRKTKQDWPRGLTDSSGRWEPSDHGERCSCCNNVRRPSIAYPYSLRKHCLSLKHVACMYNIPEEELRDTVKRSNLPVLLGLDPRIDVYIEQVLKGKVPSR